MTIQMVTGTRAIQTLDSLFLFPIEHEISTPEKSALCNERFQTLVTRTAVRVLIYALGVIVVFKLYTSIITIYNEQY